VPFTLVHAGKYRTEDNFKNTDDRETKPDSKKQKMQNTAKQKNYPCLVTVNGKQGELILQCTE